ncbi:MAG: AbrB/MazE/SpoVT family DNA-binding domain-containing protein [Thermoplasmata archaeon]|nr:AbrB/MazE/SpoVT family DNA-binding domain-containing protein [Thermoplasmata archaeon]
MKALLQRVVGYEGPHHVPLVRIPSEFVRMEGIKPGDTIGIGWENGVLVIAPLGREKLALELLESLRLDADARGSS